MGEDGDVVESLVVRVSVLVYYIATGYNVEPTDRVRYTLCFVLGS
jgi:hypothetical protein